jgi:hypothetical protein
MHLSRSSLAGLMLGACLACSVLPASAHSIGQSLEKKVGDYLVDIGYDALDITEGQEIRFDAVLIQNPGSLQWQYAPVDEVWFQIKKEGLEPFRDDIPLKLPAPAFTRYRFAEGGSYTLSVRFLGAGKTLAETSFPLSVRSKASQESATKNVALTLFGLLLVFVVGVVGYRRYAAVPPASSARKKSKPRTRRS